MICYAVFTKFFQEQTSGVFQQICEEILIKCIVFLYTLLEIVLRKTLGSCGAFQEVLPKKEESAIDD